MPKTIFVNLPVADVEASTQFYKALGFEQNLQFSQEGQAAAMVWSDTISVMLLAHEFFQTFLPAGKTIADTSAGAEALICLSFDSREEVDAITEAAANAGGRADVRDRQDLGFMYGRAFEDPDGHIYEPMFMDMEAAAAAMAEPASA